METGERACADNCPTLEDGGEWACAERTRKINYWNTCVALRNVFVWCACVAVIGAVCGPSVTFKHGITGVFLDPPYGEAATRQGGLYTNDDLTVSKQVCAWAAENGNNPKLRIALCGYEGEHTAPDGWECVSWKAVGGYSSHDNTNSRRERIWFSPHCVKESWFLKEGGLF